MSRDEIKKLLTKVDKFKTENKLDLSLGEDLSIGIMNLISIEEHLFFTSQKTGKSEYLGLLNEVRSMRASLLKEIITDYEGEVWCISKHLLAASMRLMEVGTKELKKGDKKKAWEFFEKAYKLYSLFWGINLGIVKTDKVMVESTGTVSQMSKLGTLVKKAIDCCRE
jgi:hypothetical protein